jgi:glycosyltransferase involved in cell wall biosynthesis
MNRPRLIVVGPLPPPFHGVTVSTSLVLANQLLKERFDVAHLDTSDHRSRRNVGRWDFTNVALGLANLVRLAGLLRGRAGVVYLPISQSSGAFLRDSLFVQLATLRGWRVAIHLRGSEILRFYRAQPRPYRWWMRRTLARVTSAAVVGESLRDVFGRLVPSSRIAVVANGTPPIGSARIERRGKQVLFLSSLRRRKGVGEAVAAALAVAERVPEAHFVFAGPWEDDTVERAIREKAAPLDGRIEFRQAVFGREKEDLLVASDVLLFPPREPEGHPRVVLEAISAGVPVVCTDRGAIAETIEDGVSGFVLSDPDPEELADRITRLLEDEDLHQSMSRAAFARYEERFTQEAADCRLAEWLGDVATAEKSR